MTAYRLRPCHWQHLKRVGSLVACIWLFPTTSSAEGETETLYLAVSVNHQNLPDLVEVLHHNDDFWLKLSDAQKLNISLAGLTQEKGRVRLHTRDDLQLTYDPLSQKLAISAMGEALKGQTMVYGKSQPLLRNDQLAPDVRGITLDYSLYGQQTSGSQTLSALTQLNSTGITAGTFSSSFNSRWAQGKNAASSEQVRLMSAWRYDNPEQRLSLVAGDDNSGSLSWSRSVRLGGISLTRDYSLQPGVSTEAQTIVTDSATLPSTVDLYIDGVKNSSQKVSPGQFSLSAAPTFNGSGSAEVVVTDINGRRRVINLNLYGAPDMLAAGMNSGSLNLGWLRKNYAENSFDYSPSPVSSGIWRYGLTNNLTLEAHDEGGGNGLVLAGLGGQWLTSSLTGIISLNLARSQYHQQQGQQSGLGWKWHRGWLGLSYSHQRYDDDFYDLSRLSGSTPLSASNTAWLTMALGNVGNFGLGWVDQTTTAGEHSRYGSLSWSMTLWHGASLALSASNMKTDDTREKIYTAMLSIPFSSRYQASLQSSRQDHTSSSRWQFTSQVDRSQPGWGWEVSGQQGTYSNYHAELDRLNTTSEWQLETDSNDGQRIWSGSLDGSLGWLDNHFYTMRSINDAFAIVDTSGVPDVPVSLQNNQVGVTDERGLLLLTELNGWLPNNIQIDPLELPTDYRAPETEQIVIPRANSGVKVHFDVYRTHAMLLRLRDAQGQDIAMGASVMINDAAGNVPEHGTGQTIVGYSGEVYLENPPSRGVIRVQRESGTGCQASIPGSGKTIQAIQRAEVVCR